MTSSATHSDRLRAAIDAVDRPIASARGLPNDAYTDARLFAFERDQVIGRSWEIVFNEDVHAVESMQRGRASPGFDGGVLAPVQDRTTHHFHGWVAKRYR